MKRYIGISFAVALFMVGNMAVAQTSSKPVSRYVNKTAAKETHQKLQLKKNVHVSSAIVSKRVHRHAKSELVPLTGNVKSNGIPAWTISKRVHRSEDRSINNQSMVASNQGKD